MKHQALSPMLQAGKHAALVIVLMIGFSTSRASVPKDPIASYGVFVNDKQLHIDVDSLAINAKGTLTIHALVNESPKAERLTFRILIRHRNFAGNVLLFPWDEKFKNGEAVNAIDIVEILKKVKPGDQLILIPAREGSGVEDSLLITVTGDNC